MIAEIIISACFKHSLSSIVRCVAGLFHKNDILFCKSIQFTYYKVQKFGEVKF